MKRLHQELRAGGHWNTKLVLLLLLCTFGSGSLAATCSVRDRDSLLAFKDQLIDADGVLADWTKTTDCCSWMGIVCDAQAIVRTLAVNGGQNLVAKTLQNFGAPLGNLKTLEELRLSNVRVQFRIPIPRAFFTLTNLQALALTDCQFTEPIPSELGSLTKLTELTVTGNRLSGGMPDSIRYLKQLRILSLRRNQLTTFGSSQVTSLTNLDRFDFAFNRIGGAVPKWLGGLTLAGPDFGELILDFNRLTSFPAELCNIKFLRYLGLRGNVFSGRIPSGIGNCGSLTSLILSENSLSGPLPRELGKLTNLIYLLATRNRLTGPLPRELGDLPQLTFLELQDNRITGPIPANYGPFDPIAIDPVNFTNNMLTEGMKNLDENAFRPGNPSLCNPPLASNSGFHSTLGSRALTYGKSVMASNG